MATVTTTPRQKAGWGSANVAVIALALIPVLWMVSLSFKTPAAVLDPSFLPAGRQWTWGNYTGILHTSQFIRPLINSIGIGLISTLIAVVLASMAAYAVARLRFPGKAVLIGMALLIAMFPAISLVTPMFNIERSLGLFNTWPGLIIPYGEFLGAAAAGDEGHRAAGGTGNGHHVDPGLPRLLERVPVRDLVHLDARLPDGAGVAGLLQRQLAVHGSDWPHRGRRGGHHHPDHHLRGVLPAQDRRWADIRRGQGLAEA